MDESAVTGRGAADRDKRLESWKEIAAYLGRGVTTVQRWEQLEGLPVHRLPHAKKGSVFALRSELDAWRGARAQLGPVSADATDALQADQSEGNRAWRPVRVGHRLAFGFLMLVGVAVLTLAIVRVLPLTNSDPTGRGDQSIIPRPLANDAAEEECPSLSPNGSLVVYSWRRETDPGLYIKPVAGGPPRRLATASAGDLAFCGFPKWSPAGDLIAFLVHGAAGSKDLWVISPSGERPRRLTSASGIGLCWSPDGQSLGFVDRNSAGEPFSIFSITLRGGQRRRLTAPPLGTFGDTHCAFSPDGHRLAIVRFPNRHQSDLFVTGIEETESEKVERLTTGFTGITGLAWSPDGHLIVFGSQRGLWSVPAKGPSQQAARVVAFAGEAKYPTFSRVTAAPSTHRLAYASQIIDVNNWRWDVAESRGTRLAASTWWEDFPAIAPNGDRIAFASNRTGANEIWTANADGSNPRQLTFHRGPLVVSPQWSPDGKRIAFSSQVGSNRDIYVIEADGSRSERITTAPSEEGNPTWSRDGRWLYFRSDQGGTGQIWKVPALGGTPTRVTSGEGSQSFESPDGRLLYFVRGADVPGVWTVPVDGGRETLVLADVREGFWAVADKGIYFVIRTPAGQGKETPLKFFDFASATVATVASLPTAERNLSPGFSASRDGRFMIWTQLDNSIRDLMLIDPWKP
ncbi:MAG: hypothetical protein ACT4P6_03575 [Gemmatimonadaceae bacterium]